MMEQPAWGIKIAKYFIMPQRIIVSLMGLFGIMVAYTMRICLSVAIIQLVIKHDISKIEEGLHHEHSCPLDPVPKEEAELGGEYRWSEEQQGLILSSFYWGYLVTHLPSGVLADKIGGKWTLAVGVLISSICTVLTPLAIKEGGATALIAVRVIMGCGQGSAYPALSVLISKWIPKKERTRMGSLVMGGGQLGTVVGNAVSGLLLNAFKWDITFYFFGILGFIWFAFFVILCYSDPGSHPFIKTSEKEYLLREMGLIERKTDLPPIPWVAIMTNAPMIAAIFAHIGHDWGFYIMISDFPKYMSDVLGFTIKANGLYSALPYFWMWVLSLVSGVLGDYLIRKNYMSITNSRKFFTTIAALGPAVFMVAGSYAGCDRVLVVFLFTIGMGLMGAFYAGMILTPLDLSPNYSGTLTAIANGIGAIMGILAPYSVGLMTPNVSLTEWRLVYWVAFAILCSSCIVYIVWASGEVQDFDSPQPKKEDIREE